MKSKVSIKPITINDFKWGLNLNTTSAINDNQFTICQNMFYNSKQQLQTRYWIKLFWSTVWTNKPITSYHFFQRDDTAARQALCASWTALYKYDDTLWTRSSVKTWLTEFETATWRTNQRTRWDFAVYKNIVYLTNWVDSYASYNWTTYTEYATQPKYRYINMNMDVLYWSWEDLNPSTVYYTAAAPADWSDLDNNAVVVWWDELWRINWMNELGQIMLILKSSKIYSVDIASWTALPIDAQTGWFSDRTIANVENSLVYLTERGVDTLKPRSGLSGSASLWSEPLDTDVRELTSQISEFNANANCGFYIKKNNNYYISFDTNDDNVPDTTLVFNVVTKWRTKYTYPNIYDYWYYIDSEWNRQYLVASAITDQMYEIETWFDDLWESIEHEIQTKDFDFWEPWSFKTFEYVDIIWRKSKDFDLTIQVNVDAENVWWWVINDASLTSTVERDTLGSRVIWVDPISWERITEDVTLYDYTVRIPLFATWSTINVNMSSSWWSRTLDKMRIWVNWEPIDVFNYSNII